MTFTDDAWPAANEPNAILAKAKAQRLTFAPFLFQAVCALRELGVLKMVWARRPAGATREQVAEATGLSLYAATVVLEAGLAAEVVSLENEHFRLTRVGYYLLADEMTRINLEFTRDVCYRPLMQLVASLRSGQPRGLRELGAGLEDSKTLYPDFGALPEAVQTSWLGFDHFYSESAFHDALPLVFNGRVERLLDLGANTGRWAAHCLRHSPTVALTLLDYPVQVEVARKNLSAAGLGERVSCVGRDLLAPEAWPGGFDAVWLSQVIDCLPERQAVQLLQRAGAALCDGGRVLVLEPCWDLQERRAGAEALLLTSLYFTCVANGTSRMYDSAVLAAMIDAAGLTVIARHDRLGVGHSLFECVPRAR